MLLITTGMDCFSGRSLEFQKMDSLAEAAAIPWTACPKAPKALMTVVSVNI
jgi:hypothetical protein